MGSGHRKVHTILVIRREVRKPSKDNTPNDYTKQANGYKIINMNFKMT